MSAKQRFQEGVGKMRSVFIGVAAVVLLLTACAQEKPKQYHVGILCGADFFLTVVDGFKARMTELGYVEGERINYDLQAFNTDPAKEKLAVEQFVQEKVDLIFAVPTEPTKTAQAAAKGTSIPIIFAYAGIEESGLVDSVRKPGKNITGVRFPGPDQISKRLEYLLQIAPAVKRVWIGYDRNYPNNAPSLKMLRPLAMSKGVTLVETPVDTIAEIEADLARRSESADPGLDAMLLMPDTFNHSPAGWELINSFAVDQQVPVAGSFLYTVEQGALFGNANDLFKVGELAAPLAEKVLDGTPAGTIPVVTPEQELWINFKVAQELGLTVSDGLLSMAAEIIR